MIQGQSHAYDGDWIYCSYLVPNRILLIHSAIGVGRVPSDSSRSPSLAYHLKPSNALFGVPFVKASARLSLPSIQRISPTSRRSYDSRIAMMSIIRRFCFVVPSLTSHS